LEFTVVATTPQGGFLLEASGESKPISKPTPAFLGKEKVGVIAETIASIARPYYLLRPSPGTQAAKIVGKRITTRI